MFSFITIPEGATTQLFSSASTLFNDLWVLIAVAIGIPLAFYIIKRVIGLMPKGQGGRRS